MSFATGQPISLKAILPSWFSPDDFYVLLAGIAAFLVVFAIGYSFTSRSADFGPRIKMLKERRAQLKGEALATRRRTKAEQHKGSISLMRLVVTKLKLVQKEQMGKLMNDLVTAGWRSKDAIIVYSFFKLVLPFGFMFLSFLLVKIDFSNPLASGWQMLVPFVFVYVGYKLPDIMLANARNKRYYAIQKGLSDTLDLMLICAEAGLSLSATLDRVSRELGSAYPEMAEELGLTSVEMGFLPDRKIALQNWAKRVDTAEIRGIVSVLAQTEKYGTPIAQALRVLSSEFRTQRMLRAEQKAARLPAVMTVPMIVFILPTLFIIIMAPAIIQVMDSF